jgi:hypothetical protein
MSVSENFTVLDNLPKPFIFHDIWKNIGCKYGAVSENFTMAYISYNRLFFCCLYLVLTFSSGYLSGFLTVTGLAPPFRQDLHAINAGYIAWKRPLLV